MTVMKLNTWKLGGKLAIALNTVACCHRSSCNQQSVVAAPRGNPERVSTLVPNGQKTIAGRRKKV